MSKNTSVVLGDHFENYIREQVKSGRFHSVSEVIRDALRLAEERDQKIQYLRNAIAEGEESGFIQDYKPEQHLHELKAKYGQNKLE